MGAGHSLAFRRFVFARLRIDAGIFQHQSLDRMAAHDVGFDDFVHVRLRDVSIPDGVRVNYQVRAVLALIEAPSLISPHLPLQAALGQLLLKELLQFRLAAGITASPGMSHWTLVAANENVLLELWHENPRAEFKTAIYAA